MSGACVNDCPDGYTESGSKCVKFEFCHSACSSCLFLDNPQQCTTCSSGLSSLTYQSFVTGQSSGMCIIPTANNAQYLFTLNKDTVIKRSFLNAVILNNTVT